jgi:hypothetical protein
LRLDPIRWQVRGFALMTSVMSPSGSRYEIRRGWRGDGLPQEP